MTETEIIQDVKNGSLESFDQLMQSYQGQIFKVAYGFAKNRDSAMDISQNVFLKAYQNINSFRGDSKFKTWLSRIAFNESQNWIKKNQRIHTDEHIDNSADPNQTDDEVLVQENRTLLLQSLYDLNTKYRLAVILRYYENYSIREISETLSCSEGVVKNMLFRSLQRLKTSLKAYDLGVKDVR